MSFAIELADLFRRDLTRLIQELEAFGEGPNLWTRTGGVTNSVGNLALHLEGNLREYVGRQLGSIAYVRDRDLEFSAKDVPLGELISRLTQARNQIPQVISGLNSAALDAEFPENVLGIPLSTRQFLLHLLGHLNYHLGQIDYLRRLLTGQSAISLARL